ncbi:MAG: DUF2806 domain-containing protein [Nitrospinae bacterium]|nr:DUF2806 domain-containing protein [Nitrospinota bacterium]MBL7020890.1 DUF2806 domain-containing protein [Nitrospinaceae bacterium]
MAEGNALINLGELSKPATVLIEKVSDAIGGICKPWQIKRVAKAEAEVDKVRALTGVEVSEIEQRAMLRLMAEETKKQENIENITAKAVKELKADAKPENLEPDWIANFFDKCRLVSDEEMQSLWSRLLAEEANKPGAFSKRTIELVASLDKKDAHLFTKLMGFAWNIEDEIHPLIYDHNNEVYKKQGINFETLAHLEDIGLIKFDYNKGFAWSGLSKTIVSHYFDAKTMTELKNQKNNTIQTGCASLTQTGRELATICGASKVPGFLEYVLKGWEGKGYKVSRQ